MTPKIEDFEEAFRVIKIDESKFIGAHPLRLPITGARGVYGGHIVAQALLVAIESANSDFIPHSFHLYFISPGNPRIPMSYRVTKLLDDAEVCKMTIQIVQGNKVISTCLVSLVKKGLKSSHDIQVPQPEIQLKYPDPDKLHTVCHTDYIKNAYSDEFVDYTLVPKEKDEKPSERWITIFSGVNQKKPFSDPKYNYIGLADVSDSALLTTLARVLHLPWNPTIDNPFQEHDLNRDALLLLENSFNVLHLFHYNAMSLDHHIYFHNNDYASGFDIVKDWLCFTYQVKRLSNNRTLVRGFMFNKEHKCVATIVQEGLTYLFRGVGEQAKL